MALLFAENIHKKYKHSVLNGVSLRADGGEIVGVAGENGSGKSTLLSIMTAAIRPDQGHVLVESADIAQKPAELKRWIGYVPQEDSLFGHLTALDNLKLWAAAYRTDWRNALPYLFPQDIDGARRDAAIFLKTKAAKLSGGMRKRLSIALSLMHGPRYLLMDEPSAGLDIGFKWALMDIIRDFASRGNSVLFTSHHPDELLLCDRLYVLRGGVFVYEGAPKALMPAAYDFETAQAGRDSVDYARIGGYADGFNGSGYADADFSMALHALIKSGRGVPHRGNSPLAVL